MFRFSKVGLASVVAGAVLAVGGTTAAAAPTALPSHVSAPLTAAPQWATPLWGVGGYPTAPPNCTVNPATVTAGQYVAFVCSGFYPRALVLIKGPHIRKLVYASKRGKIAVALRLKHPGFFTLSATGKSTKKSHGKHRKHYLVVTYTATVTVLPN